MFRSCMVRSVNWWLPWARSASFLAQGSLLSLSVEDLRVILQGLVSTEQVAGRLPRLRELERGFEAAGIGQIVSAVGSDLPVELATNAIASAWLQGVWSELALSEPRLAGFVGEAHNRSRDDFARLDVQHLQLNPDRIRREAAEQAVAAMNEHPEQRDLVRREAVKRSRHLSVRQLVHQAPEVLCGLRPCWMMSPLQVAEMIPAGTELFDVVIFDEASQIPPAEAIGTLARGQTGRCGRRRTGSCRPPASSAARKERDTMMILTTPTTAWR